MAWILILSLTTALAIQPAPPPGWMSGFFDAAMLTTTCHEQGPDAAASQAVCMGYLLGSIDQLMAEQSRRESSQRTICPPAGVTGNDMMAAVGRRAAWSARAAGVGAAGFVQFAMEDAFPCSMPGAAR